jgi:hypothetical protein
MAVRFLCGSCQQPIEVDDEWASRMVGCPYCRSAVMAPAVTTLTELGSVPMASPVSNREGGAGPTEAIGPMRHSRSGRNTIAFVSLFLACAAMVLMIAAVVIASAHAAEFVQYQKDVEEAVRTTGSQLRAIMDVVNARGGVLPGWMMLLGLFEMIALASWLASVVLGLIAIRKSRNPAALASLSICGFILAFFLFGIWVA